MTGFGNPEIGESDKSMRFLCGFPVLETVQPVKEVVSMATIVGSKPVYNKDGKVVGLMPAVWIETVEGRQEADFQATMGVRPIDCVDTLSIEMLEMLVEDVELQKAWGFTPESLRAWIEEAIRLPQRRGTKKTLSHLRQKLN